MSGIHFDDGELQRICAEESVWGCKEKENESESLENVFFIVITNIVCVKKYFQMMVKLILDHRL